MLHLTCDMHSHTIASGHAYGTIREMAQAAADVGLEMLGISEHAPGIPNTTGAFYYCNLKVIPREMFGVKMMFGSEINVMNDGTLSLSQKDIDRLDYAIIGIHTVCYEDAGKEKNTDNLICGMKNRGVHFVSHPDDDHTPLDYERLVMAAKEYHVALEVNNSSFTKPQSRLNCVENYRTMLALCEQHRVPVIVNSDAHDPSWVGRFDDAVRLMDEIGFDEDLVLNTSEERVVDFIRSRNN